MSLAELTSLEQLIYVMVSQEEFDYAVLNVLWAIFGILISLSLSIASRKQEVLPEIRRGALVILSMTGRADKEILSNNMDVLVKIGIGEAAKVT